MKNIIYFEDTPNCFTLYFSATAWTANTFIEISSWFHSWLPYLLEKEVDWEVCKVQPGAYFKQRYVVSTAPVNGTAVLEVNHTLYESGS